MISKENGNSSLSSATLHCDVSELIADFILPAALSEIGEESFTGGAFAYVKLPEQAVSIGWHAFADCPNLTYIYIPAMTTQIDEQAFGSMSELIIIGQTDTAAEIYAREHGFMFVADP